MPFGTVPPDISHKTTNLYFLGWNSQLLDEFHPDGSTEVTVGAEISFQADALSVRQYSPLGALVVLVWEQVYQRINNVAKSVGEGWAPILQICMTRRDRVRAEPPRGPPKSSLESTAKNRTGEELVFVQIEQEMTIPRATPSFFSFAGLTWNQGSNCGIGWSKIQGSSRTANGASLGGSVAFDRTGHDVQRSGLK